MASLKSENAIVKGDIRILTLYKQHYFDQNDEPLKCQFTCWGYYDGLDVVQPPKKGSALFTKKTEAPVSPIWFGLGKSAGGLCGRYSKQNIGIFRCPDSNRENWNLFWNSRCAGSPFLAAALIHLEDAGQFQDVGLGIEKLTDCGKADFEPDQEIKRPYRCLLSYFTFDNADLVILIRSNSMERLEETIRDIERMEEISYVHSIAGVSTPYLTQCSDHVLSQWKGIECHVDDSVALVELRISANGGIEAAGKIKASLEKIRDRIKNYSRITCMASFGHWNLLLKLPDTDMKSVLGMIALRGFINNENLLLGREIYNIETAIHMQEEGLSFIQASEPRERLNETGEIWCGKLIRKYRNRMDQALSEKDEGLSSYYRMLLQTLNTLSQYEKFSLSKDMFYLLFPALRMFDQQLDDAVRMYRKLNRRGNIDAIKDSICEFLTVVNAAIYHTVHTDQIFLMVPGYSGTSYSIPIKLCLLYLRVGEQLIRLLNEKDYQYICLLSPEMESRPATSLINMGLDRDKRLIRFCCSQRSLYMPRHFLIILTHEIAHYVGAEIRHRELRCGNIIETLSWFMAEGILPEDRPGDFDEEIYESLRKVQHKAIRQSCCHFLKNRIEKTEGERKYHATQLEKALMEGCQDFLANGETGIGKFIYQVPDIVEDKLPEEQILEFGEELIRQQNWMEHNRMVMVAANTMVTILQELILIYKEVFSDVVAFSVLNCESKTFCEAFDVSEGILLDKGSFADVQREVREYMAEKIFFSRAESVLQEEPVCPWPQKLAKMVYSYIWVEDYLLEYATKCRDSLNELLKKTKNLDLLKEIRTVYQMFSEGGKSCNEIYRTMIEQIKAYENTIEQMYQETFAEE